MKLISSYWLQAAEQQVELEGKPVRVPDSGSYIEKSGTLWCVRSNNPNDKNFGCYASREEAESHQRVLLGASQYGNTGWDYGRSVSRDTGFVPRRELAGFPRVPRTAAHPMRQAKPLGHSAPTRRAIGKSPSQHIHPPKILKTPNFGHIPKITVPKPKFVGPQTSPMGRMPKSSPLGRAPQLQGFADMGEPMTGAMGHAHIDPVTWFRPPSLTKREKGDEGRVPTDDPRETNDKFGDVTKRNSKDTIEQKYKLLKRSAPAGLPAQIPARTTALEPHQAFYMPLSQIFSSRVKTPRKLLKGSNFTSFTRRGCI